MKLTPHFTLEELCKSSTADRHEINNLTSDNEIIDRLTIVCEKILEPIRIEFGAFTVNSGFRCLELNKLLGSKNTSQHIKGEAVDIEIVGISNYDLACSIRDDRPSFDQVILEFYSPGKPSSGWVHCSYRDPEKNREQCLTINKYGIKKELLP